jgi:hypothetical protein
MGYTTAKEWEDQFIRDHYLKIPLKRLGKKINRSDCFVRARMRAMGLVVPQEIIADRKANSQFKKGHTPENKGMKQVDYMTEKQIARTKGTRFKKGHKPKNTLQDGAITVRTDHKNRSGRKYQWIRISEGKWELLHKHIWEKANGAVPEGHCLWFKDGDSMNVTLDNLECITRVENARRNKQAFNSYPEPLKKAIKTKNKLNKILKEHGK